MLPSFRRVDRAPVRITGLDPRSRVASARRIQALMRGARTRMRMRQQIVRRQNMMRMRRAGAPSFYY